jgi:uncharacterized membrane protein YhhN
MKKSGYWLVVFWLIVFVDLIIIAAGNNSLHFYTKPLLMPLLMLAFILSIEEITPLSKLIIAGLFCSFLGDVLLLWDEYFIPGLVCFLTTHVLYIIYFISIANKNGWHLKQYPLLIIFPLAYVFSIIWFLYPSLGLLKIPVIVYAGIIGAMFLSTINLYKKVKRPVDIYFIAGALFFVLSDSLLAINKFHSSFPYSGIAVMFTYCLAQFLIVRGSFIGKSPDVSR